MAEREAEQATEAVLDALSRRLRGTPGIRQAIADRLGVARVTLNRWLRQDRPIPLVQLVAILLAFEERLEDWLRPGFAGPDVRALLGRPAWAEVPRLVADLRRVAASLPAVEPTPALAILEVEGLRGRLRSGERKERLAWLEALDEPGEVLAALAELVRYVYESPKKAEPLAATLARVSPRLAEGSAEAFCRAAGVVAAARRLQGDLPAAAELLRIALQRARRQAPESLMADLYREAARLLCDRWEHEAALAVSRAAEEIYRRVDDPVAVERTRVDRGRILLAAGRAEEASGLLERALDGLPLEARWTLLWAYLAQSQALVALGRHRAAADALFRAEALAGPGERYALGSVAHARGVALAAGGDPELAVEALHEGLDHLASFGPYVSVPVTLDLIEALLRLGRREEAGSHAAAMKALLPALSTVSPAARSAVAGFCCQPEVRLADVDALRRALERARPPAARPKASGEGGGDLRLRAEAATQDLLDALRRRLQERHGTQRQVQRRLGVSRVHFQRWLGQERKIPLVRLAEVLVALEERLDLWIRPGGRRPDIRALLGRPMWGSEPHLVYQVRRAASSLPALDPSPALPVPEVPGLAVRLRSGPVSRRAAWLAGLREPEEVLAAAAALEGHRQLCPQDAERLSRTLLIEACPRLEVGSAQAFCRVAGVLASARRMQGDLPAAAEILRVAIQRARRQEPASLLADLYQRAGYVFFNRVQFQASLAAIGAAERIYRRLDDHVALTKLQADRGFFLTAAGRAEEALPVLHRALDGLPWEAKGSRLACYFWLGRALASLGCHREAADALDRAEKYLEPGQAYNRCCLVYERGTALAAAGDVKAVKAYREARELLRDLNPFSLATVTLDLVEMLILLGRRSEAVIEARSMASLLKPFAASSKAEAAIATFLGRAARVELDDVLLARQALEKARPRGGGLTPGG